MEFRYLGKTGLRVSELCLGTMTFGRETSEQDSFKILDRFVAEGGNFIDTADVYTRGVSEEIVGKWLQGQKRDDVVIATKVRFPMGEGPNDIGLSRKHIMNGVKESLHRLGTDYIDLYQVHGWDPRTPLEETLSTLNDLVREGLVRYIGASNFKGWQLQKAIDISRRNGWEAFVCLQPQYNLLCRATEWELLDVCINEGLGVIPWSPLRGGWLSGKYTKDMVTPPENTRVALAEKEGWGESWSNYNNEFTWQVLETLYAVAKEAEKTPAQAAINWLLNQPGVTAPIIGARTMEQLEANLGAAGWSLTKEQIDRLNRASDLYVTYPYNQDAINQRNRGRE
ncbi:aldo/keto reductase [Bacillus sp. AFS076308]|uniref:aldo/keto reductase n=1 Tax=unclassified Bacillus (in: firmicutes) TaxID=185979 RepID=UPI000BF7C49A|nr:MULTISPECIES: aldo/keto reductase [unclassified Bacillus (in: firmicutes)]PFN96370.1 aldo/keto reductase [Bacillus sp. AFS076308]PGV46540.1 aldo/keto reductase [Bacillus sp. AFS037270]